MVLSAPQVRLIKRLLFLLIPYSVLRIGFYFYHLNIYKQFTQDEIFQSFLLGIRFDVAAICLLNLPLVLLSCFYWVKEKTERVLFILINTCGFIVAVDDYELFLFTGKRLSYDFFVISEDILQQLPQIILYYWYLPLAAIAFGIAFYFFDKRYFKAKEVKIFLPVRVMVSVILLGLTFVGIRGGLQHKSINVQSAFVQGKNELGHLVLNSPYHFLRTLKNKPMKPLALFKSDDEAKNIILNQRDFRDGIVGKPKSNVVLIILESFASEYMEEGYTPFLSELRAKSFYFSRHLANGRKSIEALPSLLCGLPSLLDEPISKSIYSGNKFSCFPKALKSAGYTNHFFHAGAKGTMGFESYTLANGFDRYFSRHDYGEKDFDGTWGIFDGPYLQYVADRIGEMPEPFLAGVFTLSSHQPYTLPGEFRGKFPKGKLEIHPSIGYTDYALRKFFDRVQNEKWFNNTIFVITSDHSQKLETKRFSNLVGRYRVPLLIYIPGGEGKEFQKVTQHSDIPKSVLDYLEIKSDELPATSVSVFSDDEGAAFNYTDGLTYFMARKEVVTILDKSYQQQSFTYDWDTGEMHQVESNNPLLKAYLQYFMNGLINNNLSL